MRKLVFFMFFFCGLGIMALGQEKTVTGTITAADDGTTIIGATVTVKGTTRGVTSDLDGNYSIEVEEGETLVFSFVGMKTQEIVVGSSNTIDVILEPDLLGIDEVVVIAYGTTKKESFTGSASVVKSEKLSRNPTTSVVKALQANAAGVQVVNSSGASNAEPTIRIRGVGSITASSDPLWVVDGVIGAQVPNVSDIESVTVLKDAAAASLYGSRAANGVVVVTTKKGQRGKTKFTYTGKQSYATKTTNKFQMLDAGEFYQKSWEGIYNFASDNAAEDPDWLEDQGEYSSPADYAHQNLATLAGRNPYDVVQPFDDNGNLVSGAELMLDNSWFEQAFQTGVTTEHNLTASGGDERTRFYFSGTYYDSEAITIPDQTQKVMGHINVTSEVSDKVKVGYTSTLTYRQGNTVKDITNGSGTMYAAYAYPNNVPLYVLDENFETVIGADGEPEWNWDNLVSKDYNPIAQNELDPRGSRSTNIFNTVNFNWQMIEGLFFDTKVSGSLYSYNSDFFRNPYHGDGKAYGGSSDKNSEDQRRIMTSSTLTYNKEFGGSNINLLGGYETEYYIRKTVLAAGKGFDVPFSDELDIASEPMEIGSSTTETSMISYFSRVNYDLNDKYYISGSFRRDGSSRFGPESRWANFWSASASWRISQENFMVSLGWLDDFKIRASYGTNGNQAVPPYAYYPVYGLGYNYDYNVGMMHARLSNYELRWEKNKVLNVGIEFGILQFLRGSVEFFDRNTDDLLQDKPLAPSVGFDSRLENVGGLNNRGFEIELNSTNIQNTNLVWLTDFNFSRYSNEITALSQEEIISGTKRWVVGNSLYEWYLREWAGVDSQTGEAMWYKDVLDTEGNPTGERETTKEYDEATRYELGQSIPDFYGGLTNTFIIMDDLTFSFQLYWSVGGKVYNSLLQQTMNDGSRYGHQLNEEVLDSWQEPGDETDVPRFVYNNNSQSWAQSSRYLEDGSFLRLRNINLNYRLPERWTNSIGVEAANVFINGDNLFVLTKYAGNDPEQGLSGLTNTSTVPNVRTVTFGVSLNF
ncbi:MAG: SusC/RagA family TonB-linked outer membrane protein [Bacteroidota bacterium]